mmetsp:Transcript_24209/g.60613  ORF Transcript_24209/g.60613 Transcript_24209/m.60613 type:complete len:284 (+) Transcript_24209:5429-6280(+)
MEGNCQIVLAQGGQREHEPLAKFGEDALAPNTCETSEGRVAAGVDPVDALLVDGHKQIGEVGVADLVVVEKPEVRLVEHVGVVPQVDQVANHTVSLALKKLVRRQGIRAKAAIHNLVVHENILLERRRVEVDLGCPARNNELSRKVVPLQRGPAAMPGKSGCDDVGVVVDGSDVDGGVIGVVDAPFRCPFRSYGFNRPAEAVARVVAHHTGDALLQLHLQRVFVVHARNLGWHKGVERCKHLPVLLAVHNTHQAGKEVLVFRQLTPDLGLAGGVLQAGPAVGV